jgi:hypothetical protein
MGFKTLRFHKTDYPVSLAFSAVGTKEQGGGRTKNTEVVQQRLVGGVIGGDIRL